MLTSSLKSTIMSQNVQSPALAEVIPMNSQKCIDKAHEKTEMKLKKSRIKCTRSQGAVVFTIVFVLFVVETCMLIYSSDKPLCSHENSKNITNPTSKNEDWTIEQSIKNFEYENCEKHFDLGYNIVASICNREDFGEVFDVRVFINEKPTIKGIGIPYTLVPRLHAVVQELID